MKCPYLIHLVALELSGLILHLCTKFINLAIKGVNTSNDCSVDFVVIFHVGDFLSAIKRSVTGVYFGIVQLLWALKIERK